MLTAHELSAAYANGLSPNAVVAATLARINEINPHLNAIITLDANGALRAADDSMRRWQAGQPLGPLDGVPISIKDNILVSGLRATWGSRLYEHHIPDHDERPVQRLRAAGAVILGKTNVPELTVQGFTHNTLFGTTVNPWDVSLTPGGSSGGAVAAVASGMGAIALGTDGGGSIRRPAAHTGLVGFKPSREMVPRGQGFPAILYDFEVAGPIARCVDDVMLAMDVIAGPGWRGPTKPERPVSIAYAPTFGAAPVDPLIASAVASAVDQLRRLDHEVVEMTAFDLAAPLEAIWSIISQTGVAWLMSQHPGQETKAGAAIAEMAAAGTGHAATDYLSALDAIAAMRAAFEEFFDRYDFLITPATAAMPWAADEVYPRHITGQAVGPRGHAVFTPVANALGLPAISVPCKVGRGEMPIGMQIIAAWNCDRGLLNFARDYERHCRPHQWPQL